MPFAMNDMQDFSYPRITLRTTPRTKYLCCVCHEHEVDGPRQSLCGSPECRTTAKELGWILEIDWVVS